MITLGVLAVWCALVGNEAIVASTNSTGGAPLASVNTPKPYRDAPGQLFRWAPMRESSRSVVLPLQGDVHLAFDAHLLRTHTVALGPSLSLWGPPYHAGKTPFLAKLEGPLLWTMPPIFPWSQQAEFGNGHSGQTSGASFRGISTQTNQVSLHYEIRESDGASISVTESARAWRMGTEVAVARRIELSPHAKDLFFLAHSEQGSLVAEVLPGNAVAVRRSSDTLITAVKGTSGLQWMTEQANLDLASIEYTEKGSDSLVITNRITGAWTHVVLHIPASKESSTFEIATLVTTNANPAQVADILRGELRHEPEHDMAVPATENRPGSPVVFSGNRAGTKAASGDQFFRIEHFPVPKEIDLLVGGMDWLPNGDLAVATWRGEIYIIENTQGRLEDATYRRFAAGLNEPLGLKVVGNDIVVVQKHEITRLSDTNDDGVADHYQTINNQWGYTGNYHAYAFGPLLDPANNLYVFICGQRGLYEMPFQGWAVKISSSANTLEGFCSGLRAPNGWTTFGPDQDLFVTENQGNWVGACKLNHLRPGKFFGYPSSHPELAYSEQTARGFEPPALWFPRKLAPSASGVAVISDNRFGPFAGQMLVGDFQNGIVMRVALEKVNNAWQGAVWPFAKGFLGAVNRLSYGPDGKLYVGGCRRAWSTPSPQEYSLERVVFTGEMPFEVKEVRARHDGFDLVFTKPLQQDSAEDLQNFSVTQHRYAYHEEYGSPEIDYEGQKNRASEVRVIGSQLSPDGQHLRLKVESWKAGYVTTVQMAGLTSTDGTELRHDVFYYTLNHLPPP